MLRGCLCPQSPFRLKPTTTYHLLNVLVVVPFVLGEAGIVELEIFEIISFVSREHTSLSGGLTNLETFSCNDYSLVVDSVAILAL